MVDQVKIAKQKTAKDARAAIRKKAIDLAVEIGNAAIISRETKYRDDPRIGPSTRLRCVQFPAVAQEIYRGLEGADAGKTHPSWVDRLGRDFR